MTYTKRRTLMVVDDNIVNLKVGKSALEDAYNVFTVASAENMFNILKRKKPEMILLDVDMPEMDGYEAIKILKEQPETRNIPVIFLTAKIDAESEAKGRELGAIDYITKPILPPLLRERVDDYFTGME